MPFLNSGEGLKTVRLGLVTLVTRFDRDAGQRAAPQQNESGTLKTGSFYLDLAFRIRVPEGGGM